MADNIIAENTNINEIGTDGSALHTLATPAIINCHLEVGLRTDNAVVYICKEKVQCFNFTAFKCCSKGNITINLIVKDGYDMNLIPNEGYHGHDWYAISGLWVPGFGAFMMNPSGICFTPFDELGTGSYNYDNLAKETNPSDKVDKETKHNPPTEVTLTFRATSACNDTIDFPVKFVYDPCRCCCKCRR